MIQQGTDSDPFLNPVYGTAVLRLNRLHPFVAVFYDEFFKKKLGQRPLELFAMAEVLVEAHLHSIGVKAKDISEFLSARDRLLRYLADRSGRTSAHSVANALAEARNNPRRLEECVCNAFRSLGFDVTNLGKSGEPDGVAIAHLSAAESGKPRHYKVCLEAKSKVQRGAKVSAKAVGITAIKRHCKKYNCDHAIVVGPDFPTSQGDESALGESIEDGLDPTAGKGRGTITLIRVDDLALLVRLRAVKQVDLLKMRELFMDCRLPEQSSEWVRAIQDSDVPRPPYREIVETIGALQKKFKMAPVSYSSLRVELSHRTPAIDYERDDELVELCRGMAQMAPGAIFASSENVELDQSAENVIDSIERALQEFPLDELGGSEKR